MKKIGFFVILALIIRVIALFILKPYIAGDSLIYFTSEANTIVSNILSGNGYVHHFLNTDYYFYAYPLYYHFLAALQLIAGKNNYLAIGMFQAVIAAFSILPLIFIADKAFNKNTAFVLGLLYSLHPGLVAYTAMPGALTFIMSFILTITWLMVYFSDKKWALILIGTLTGLSLFVRPTIIFLVPAFFIYLIVKKEPVKKIFLKLFIVMLLIAAVVSPWIYRGYRIYNHFIFMSLTSAESFWRGNNPIATGTGLTKGNRSILSEAMDNEDFKNRLYSLDELGQYKFFKDEAIRYIKNHPVIFLKLTLRKFIYFWSYSPQTGKLYPPIWLIIYKSLYYLLALFFILGIYFIFKNKHYVNMPIIIFLFSIFIMLSFLQSLYYVDTRHRWMIEPLIMIVSSYGIKNLFQSLGERFG